MPGDINSFALNLELKLQDSASEALRKVSSSTASIETKINDINVRMSKFGSTTEQAGGTLQKMFSNASKAIKDFASTQETKLKNNFKGNQLIGAEAKQTEQMADHAKKSDTTRGKMEKDYQKLVTNFSKKAVKNSKGEIVDKKTMQKLSKDQLKDYNKMQKLRTTLGKSDEAEVKTKTKARNMTEDGQKSTTMFGNMLQRVKTSVTEVGTTILDTFSGVFHSLLGGVASATSIMGLFEVGIMKAGEREEKFHTINYRQLGTMEQINDVFIQLGKSSIRLTTDELADATIALRSVGASAKEIDTLRNSIAIMGRETGVDIKILSKFSHNLTAVTKNEALAGQQMLKMIKMGRDFALEGSDMATIMDQVSSASLYLGAAGSDNVTAYSDALMRGVAGAKQLGLSAQDAAGFLRKMEDPLSTVAVLGPKSLNWGFEKRSEEMGKWADKSVKALEAAEKAGHGFKMRQKLAAKLGVEAGDVMKTLKLAQAQANKANQPQEEAKPPATAKGAEEKMAEFLKTTEGIERLAALSADKVAANLQDKLSPVKQMLKDLLDMFVSDPMYPALAAIGIIGVAVGGLLFAAFMGIVGVVGTVVAGVFALGGMFLSAIGTVAMGALSLLVSGVGIVVQAVFGLGKVGFSVFEGLAGAAGGVVPLLTLMAQGAALAAAAYVGWQIGKIVNDFFGMSDAIDRVNKGQGTWTDYLKYYATAAGPISSFYKSYLDWSNKAADAKEREIRMNREEAKSHWVTEKLAMQEAYRKATIAGDKDQMNALDKQLQQMLKDEQKEYEQSEQYKTVTAANAAKDRAQQQQDITTKAAEKAPEGMSIGDKLGINSDDVNKMIEKLKSMLPSGAQVKDAFGQVKDYVQPALDRGAVLLKGEFDALVAKLQDSKTFAPAMQMMEDAMAKVKQTAGPVFEKGGAMLQDAIKQYGPQAQELIKNTLQQGTETLQKLMPVRPDSIVTVKTDDQTARPSVRRDEEHAARMSSLTDLAKAQLDVIKIIADKMDPETAKKIRELLERTLPEMTSGSSGLASSANQWVN